MQLKISDLFATPDHFLFAFEGEHSLFLEMDRAAYQRSIFLDRRIVPLSERMLQVPTAQLTAYRDQAAPTPRIGWIFHVAHCGSTMLARALDVAASDLVLREPMVTRQLGVEAATGFPGRTPDGSWLARLRLAITMLGRRYGAGPVIVKANVPVNFIVPQLLAMDPAAPALFLYFPLDQYLMAILRTPNHVKWVESITAELRPALEAELGSLGGLDAPRLAAALWLAQMRIYARALDLCPQARSLHAEGLFDTPRPVLEAAFRYFGLPSGAVDIDALVKGPLFSTYSKNPQVAFDNDKRRERQENLKREMARELEAARRWVMQRLDRHPLPARLPAPLAGESPELLMRA